MVPFIPSKVLVVCNRQMSTCDTVDFVGVGAIFKNNCWPKFSPVQAIQLLEKNLVKAETETRVAQEEFVAGATRSLKVKH